MLDRKAQYSMVEYLKCFQNQPVSYTIKNNSLLLLNAIHRRYLGENNLEFSYDTNFHHDKSQGESKQEDSLFYNRVSE